MRGESGWDCRISEKVRAPTHKITRKSHVPQRNRCNLKLPPLDILQSEDTDSTSAQFIALSCVKPLCWVIFLCFICSNLQEWKTGNHKSDIFPKISITICFGTTGFIPLTFLCREKSSFSLQSPPCKRLRKGWLLQTNKRVWDLIEHAVLSS